MSASATQFNAGYGNTQQPALRQPQHRPLDATQQGHRIHPAYRQQSSDPLQLPVRTSSNGRFHVRAPPPEYARLAESTSYANLYNIRGYDDYNYYAQGSQWPNHPPQLNQYPRAQVSTSAYQNVAHRSQNPGLEPLRSRPDQLNSSNLPPRTSSATASHSLRPPPRHGSGQPTRDGYGLPPQHRQPAPNSSTSHYPRSMNLGMYALQSQSSANMRQDVRKAPHALPPSARKGPASYYSQGGAVQSIEEETNSQRGSAHSANLLSNDPHGLPSATSYNATSSTVPQYYLEHQLSQDQITRDVSPIESDYGSNPELAVMGETNSWQGVENSSHSPSPELLTSSLTQIPDLPASSRQIPADQHVDHDIAGPRDLTSIPRDEADSNSVPCTVATSISPGSVSSESIPLSDPTEHVSSPSQNLTSGANAIDAASSEVENEPEARPSEELIPQEPHSHSPITPLGDSQVDQILDSLARGGASSPTDPTDLKQPMHGLSERVGKRRPLRLNMDSVREAEARGSLTSLSDLIKRATRLASNLDQGKTASRLGLDWFPDQEEGEKFASNPNKRRSGASLSDMLASFPPAGLPIPGKGRRDLTRRQSKPLASDSGSVPARRRPRYCCGMRLWLFISLLSLLVLLIAAAIIIPIALVVIPRHQNHDGRSLSSCAHQLACDNGGAVTESSEGNCQCLCINGYTGLNCSTAPATGCATASFGSHQNATVGDSLPSLIQSAYSNFGIPLNGDTLTDLFSAANLTCNTENAMVTFNGLSRKRSAPESEVISIVTATTLIYETGTPPTTTQIGLATTTQSPAPATTTSLAAIPTSTMNVDFARVAVLYVFQASKQLDTAIIARENLQSYISIHANNTGTVAIAGNVTLGNGFSADLVQHRIRLANGTTVGGT